MKIIVFILKVYILCSIIQAQIFSEIDSNLVSKESLEFRIDFEKDKVYKNTKDIYLICSWTNISKRTIKFLLKEEEAYHGTLLFPTNIYIKIWNEEGEILTKNQIDYDWWSWYFLWSTTFNIESKDIYELNTQESLVRKIKMLDILKGLNQFDDNLPRGIYFVQLLYRDNYSNVMSFQIEP
jgi:hypothetical protein